MSTSAVHDTLQVIERPDEVIPESPSINSHIPLRADSIRRPSITGNQSIHSQLSLNPESYLTFEDPYRAAITPYAVRRKKSQLGDTGSVKDFNESSQPDVGLRSYIRAFLLETLPRQVYLYALLGLPSLYFYRVARIFEEAEMSLPDVRHMALQASFKWVSSPFTDPPASTRVYDNFKATWEFFIDSLMREWKTLNIVSVLLLSAILTTLQIGSAAEEPMTRYCALFSLVCALMSLLYGCMFIIRFNSMRKTYKAVQWAEDAQRTTTNIFWNAWVMLAMPAAWLSWAIILYIMCIMSFIWRTGGSHDPTLLSMKQALIPRTLISVILAIGIIYFVLIMLTLRRYGKVLDEIWKNRLVKWNQGDTSTFAPSVPQSSYAHSLSEYFARRQSSQFAVSSIRAQPSVGSLRRKRPAESSLRSDQTANDRTIKVASEDPINNISENNLSEQETSGVITNITTESPWKPKKAVDLRFSNSLEYQFTDEIMARGIQPEEWRAFINDIIVAYTGKTWHISRPPQDLVADRLAWWNYHLFFRNNLQAILCREYLIGGSPDSPLYAVYIIMHTSTNGVIDPLDIRIGQWQMQEGIERVEFLDPVIAGSRNVTDTRRGVHFQGTSEGEDAESDSAGDSKIDRRIGVNYAKDDENAYDHDPSDAQTQAISANPPQEENTQQTSFNPVGEAETPESADTDLALANATSDKNNEI